MTEKTIDNRTYLLEMYDGSKRKITVPASWKVTFGPAAVPRTAPSGNKAFSGNANKMPMAIRFYESKDQQRAIFTDVVNFRDMSIPILEERVEVKTKRGTLSVDGANRNVSMNATIKQWLNPDEDNEEQNPLLDFDPMS